MFNSKQGVKEQRTEDKKIQGTRKIHLIPLLIACLCQAPESCASGRYGCAFTGTGFGSAGRMLCGEALRLVCAISAEIVQCLYFSLESLAQDQGEMKGT